MAVRRKKKQVKKLKFELTKSGIAGIGVIAFCLFLWMFLLGVWAGQSLLLPSYGKHTTTDRNKTQNDILMIRADKRAVKNNN